MTARRYTVRTHGLGAYKSSNCKCPVCRAANAAYMRERRARAARRAAPSTDRIRDISDWGFVDRYVAPGVQHGTRSAYDEHGCRCRMCSLKAREWKASPNGAVKPVAA